MENEHERKALEAYFSISHLVQNVTVEHEDGRTTKRPCIVVRGKDYKGKIRWQALGGGAKLTQKGIRLLKKRYGSNIRLRNGEESNDARFYLPITTNLLRSHNKESKNAFILSTLLPFMYNSDIIEWSAIREVRSELQKHIPNLPTERVWVTECFKAVSPIKWSVTGSDRSDGAIFYERIFHLFDLNVPEDIWPMITASSSIRVLSKDDILMMRRATQNHESMTELSDGSVVAENIFPW